jgi:hypothetical protein
MGKLRPPVARKLSDDEILLPGIPGKCQTPFRNVVRAREENERREERPCPQLSGIAHLGDPEYPDRGFVILGSTRLGVGQNAMGRSEVDTDDVLTILQEGSPC